MFFFCGGRADLIWMAEILNGARLTRHRSLCLRWESAKRCQQLHQTSSQFFYYDKIQTTVKFDVISRFLFSLIFITKRKPCAKNNLTLTMLYLTRLWQETSHVSINIVFSPRIFSQAPKEFCFCFKKKKKISPTIVRRKRKKIWGWFVTIASKPQAPVFVLQERREETNFGQRWNRMTGVGWTKPVWGSLRYWMAAGYLGPTENVASHACRQEKKKKNSVTQPQHLWNYHKPIVMYSRNNVGNWWDCCRRESHSCFFPWKRKSELLMLK